MRFSFRRSLQIEFLARETPNCTLPRTCTHISHQWTCESVSGSHLRSEATRRNPQRCYDPSDDRDGTAGVPSTQPVLVREPTSAFSSLGRLVLSSMLDAMEQGAQRPEESTIIPFSESRYRSSDREGRTYRRAKPIFYKCALRGYSHYTLLRKVVRQARHLCAQSAALMCLMGHPIPRYTHEGQCV